MWLLSANQCHTLRKALNTFLQAWNGAAPVASETGPRLYNRHALLNPGNPPKIFKGWKRISADVRPYDPNCGRCTYACKCRNLRVWVILVCHSWPFKWLATKKCQRLCTTELEWSVYNLNWAYAWDGTRELWVTVSYSWASNAVWEWLGPLSAHDMDICRLCRRIIPKSVCKDARNYTDASRI